MRDRSPRGEPAVRVLAVIQDDGMSATGSEPRTWSPWLVVAVVAALVTGLGYGFVLGRGGRPSGDAASTTSTTALRMIRATVGSSRNYPVAFDPSPPGRDLGPGVTEYLNPNVFLTIAVDQAGLIWAGGPAGVVRLNPVTGEFDRLTDSDGTGPLDVRDLAVGLDGSMFAGTARGMSHWDGFEWAQDSVLIQEMSEEGRLTPQAGPLAVAPDGTVWFVTREALWWKDESYVHHGPAPFDGDVPTTRLDGYINDLAIGPGGVVWALTFDGLWRYDGAWSQLEGYGFLSAMAVDTEGGVWLGLDGEIVHIEAEDGATTTVTPWVEAVALDDTAEPLEGSIRVMAAGPDGSAWALAEVWEPGRDWGGGDYVGEVLMRIEDGTISTVALPDALDTWIADMAVAPNGDLWVATEGRVLQFDGTGWSEFFIADQPPINDIGAMTVDPAGDLWFAGNDGVTRLTSDGWHTYDRAEFSTGSIGDLDGDIWVGSAGDRVWVGIGCRVFEYDATRWNPLPILPNEPLECSGAVAAARSDGSLWLAATRPYESITYVYRWADDEWSFFGQLRFQPSHMDVGPDGAVWLAGGEGLGRLDDDGWSRVVTGQEFEQVVVAADGTVWVSANGWMGSTGVWRFYDGVWEIDQQEPSDSSTVGFARHPEGSVWTLDRGGDGQFNAHITERGLRRYFIVDDGDLHAMAIGPDGTIWVGGDGLLYRITPVDKLSLTPMDWSIELDDPGPSIHTVFMIADASPLDPRHVSDTSGHLVWEETVVELCAIGIGDEDGILTVGDIFQTTEGCGSNPTAMQDAFDQWGLPHEACVFVDVDGLYQPLSYCEPLSIAGSTRP